MGALPTLTADRLARRQVRHPRGGPECLAKAFVRRRQERKGPEQSGPRLRISDHVEPLRARGRLASVPADPPRASGSSP